MTAGAHVSRSIAEVQQAVAAVARAFAAQRDRRMSRTALAAEDFEQLAAAGFLLTAVPVARGGLWSGVARSVRPYCTMVRALAQADPSLALVTAMHPSVLAFWLAPEALVAAHTSLRLQAERFFDSAHAGHWWGTVISEPGSGGDPMRTQSAAVPTDDGWRLSGAKHFASGAGIASFMITTARAADATYPDVFIIDMRDRAWDGSTGLEMVRAWDGHGMMATQSHAFALRNCPAERAAHADLFHVAAPAVGQLTPLLFAAVVMGILDSAMSLARASIKRRQPGLRAYEQVAWVQTANQAWLAEQAYEGALRTVESGTGGLLAAGRAKLTIAELSESALATLARVLGGASFSHSQPFGQWAQDVRALGFLRPPWGYAYDQLMALEVE
jgi:alkylation response protein AidB-like acyl-CoA dehydrogenase